MASKAFAAVAANTKLSKNLDTVIVGAPALGEGTYDVSIHAVDTSAWDDDKLTVTYVTADGRTFTDRMFTMSNDKQEFSYGLRALWSAVLADKDAIGKLIELAAASGSAFEMLTGAKLRITLVPGKGIQARSTGTGMFAGYDIPSGDKVTDEHTEIKLVYDEVKGRGLKRSYLQVKRAECTHKEENLAAFKFAVEAKEKAQGSGTVSAFSAGKAV